MTDDLRERLYGIAGRTAGEAALEHGRNGGRIRLVTDAFVLSRIARAIVDAVLSALPRLTEEERAAILAGLNLAEHHYGPPEGPAATARAKLQAGAILPERVGEEELREAAKQALDVLGSSHVVVEGPNAGWRGEGQDLWYDDDLVPAPDCPVCAAENRLRAALEAALTPSQPAGDP